MLRCWQQFSVIQRTVSWWAALFLVLAIAVRFDITQRNELWLGDWSLNNCTLICDSSSLFCDFTRCRLVFCYRLILPVFEGQTEDCCTLEDGADRLSLNVGNELQVYATQNPWRAKSSWNPGGSLKSTTHCCNILSMLRICPQAGSWSRPTVPCLKHQTRREFWRNGVTVPLITNVGRRCLQLRVLAVLFSWKWP